MDMLQRFDQYARSFLTDDASFNRNIELKLDHSIRVYREIDGLAAELDLSTEDRAIADTMGLYHDIGRFEQFRRYRTFSDSQSVDHAALGVRIIEEKGLLADRSETERALVLTAIAHHNKRELPDHVQGRELWFTRLLRDADKLDIWKVVTDYYDRRDHDKNEAIELDLPDTPGISDTVYEDLINRRSVEFSHMENLNDFKLLQMAWIFDLNFGAAVRRVKERGYLEKIRAVLPDTPKIEEIYASILDYRQQATP